MFTYIESLEDLEFLNKELSEKLYIGVDTEFRRTTKDNMRLALLQINDQDEIYLIDAKAIEDPKEQANFLFSDSVVKIFHSCKEDLEAVHAWTDNQMTNIFDTQLANSFLGSDFSISYQALVEKKLGINLEKTETRSNWMRRPLTDSQLKYAALDVEYLIPIYLDQASELKKYGKNDWYDQEIQKLIKTTFNPYSLEDLKRVLPRSQESEMLTNLSNLILEISKRENINATMFFSKKAQKIFLRLMLTHGLGQACEGLTQWRRLLLEERLYDLLR